MSRPRVKICGLKTRETVAAAVASGAAYLGFNFVEKSKRFVDIETARSLAGDVPPGVAKVALVLDADDPALDAIIDRVPLDMLQLHGEEPPERVNAVKDRYGLPVMKAVGIGGADDLQKIDIFSVVADQLLVDTKPPKDGDLPGGTGLSFDWRLIANRRWSVPWMLAGGLTPENVADAIALTGAQQIDVASGVESAPGVKDPALIHALIAATDPSSRISRSTHPG